MAETYTADKNDCMESIAAKFDFGDYRVIYDHPNNAELKAKRPKPNLLVPGDKIFIPDKEIKEESGATDQTHKFQLLQKKVKFRVQLKDDKGKFFADKKYELKFGETLFEGSTDGQGFIEKEINAKWTTGELKLFTEDDKIKVLVWNLSLGNLEPVETDMGVQDRLRNLGYYYGDLSGDINPKTESAVEAFKDKNSMTVNKDVDDALRGKLRDSHDKKG